VWRNTKQYTVGYTNQKKTKNFMKVSSAKAYLIAILTCGYYTVAAVFMIIIGSITASMTSDTLNPEIPSSLRIENYKSSQIAKVFYNFNLTAILKIQKSWFCYQIAGMDRLKKIYTIAKSNL
jgi:hypothetical protein